MRRGGSWCGSAWSACSADFVYEGARSSPARCSPQLGACAAVVGVVTGAGEAAALAAAGLRAADRPHRPVLGLDDRRVCADGGLRPAARAASVLWAACGLVIAERVGKAVRSPAKDTLLSHATAAPGAAAGSRCTRRWTRSARSSGRCGGRDARAHRRRLRPGPGRARAARRRGPRRCWCGCGCGCRGPAAYETWRAARTPAARRPAGRRPRLPRAFWAYAVFTALTMPGSRPSACSPSTSSSATCCRPPRCPCCTPPRWSSTPWPRSPPAGCTTGRAARARRPAGAGRGRAGPGLLRARWRWPRSARWCGAPPWASRSPRCGRPSPTWWSGRRATAYGIFAAVVGDGAAAGGVAGRRPLRGLDPAAGRRHRRHPGRRARRCCSSRSEGCADRGRAARR